MLKAIFNGNKFDIVSIRSAGYNRYIFELSKSDNFYYTVSLTIKGAAIIKRNKIYIVEA